MFVNVCRFSLERISIVRSEGGKVDLLRVLSLGVSHLMLDSGFFLDDQ